MTETHDQDVVAVGLLPDPFITSGPWVVHPYWESLPPGSGVPLYDTPCKPVPLRELCDRSAHGPTTRFVTANHLTAVLDRRLGTFGATAVSMLVAGIVGLIGVAMVWLAAAVVAADRIGSFALGAAVASGLLLMIGAAMNGGGRR